MNLLSEGGALMYPLLLLLILVIVLLIKGFLKKEAVSKTIKLVNSISLFALVLGFLGQIFGLIGAFDAIEASGSISYEMFAGGLKVSFLSAAFGAFIFLVGRLGIIVFTFSQN